VRAGLAERAEAYRWSGWGAAVGGEVSASLRAWARAGIAGMLGTERKRGEKDEDEEGEGSHGAGLHCAREDGEGQRRFLESYGLLVRVKDDTQKASGETATPGPGTGLLDRAPALLRGAVVGTSEFVTSLMEQTGIRQTRPPKACSGLPEPVFHARRPRSLR
ncbi:MAG: hypothetical protein JJU00_11245, partial [Opitutales bacterium]|nr:hypothetical protein [Opitutales bacterium]